MSALGVVLGAAALATQVGPGELTAASPGGEAKSLPVVSLATEVPGKTANVVSDGAVDLNINEKKSELVLSYAWATRTQDVSTEDLVAQVVQDSVSVELTLPLGGGDDLLARETFDGLVDGPSLSVSWTSFGVRTSDPYERPGAKSLARHSAARCEEAVRAGEAEDYTVERCRLHATRPERDFLRRWSGLSVPALNRRLLSPVTGFGLEGSIGLNRFKYRTALTLAENEDTKPQFSIKAYGILFPSDGVSMLTGSALYESGYEAQEDEILCRAVVANPNDDCASAAPGPPTKQEKVVLEVEYRRAFRPIRGLGRFAIAPRAAFDALSDEYELELPIYLKLQGTDVIMPGLTVAYDSRHDKVTAGLFLRKTFSF